MLWLALKFNNSTHLVHQNNCIHFVNQQLILIYNIIQKDVVLPVITNQKMNAYLKEIADLARIEKHLTTHLARHTFASLSLSNHVPIESISKMLGHADIRTTQIYAKTQDKTIYEDMESMRHKFDCAMMN